MDILSFILLICAFSLSYTFTSRYFMHIFQINSYNTRCYFSWMEKRLTSVLPKALLVLSTIPLIIFFGDSGMLISGIIYIVLAYFFKPKDTRSPMVYTKPVIRMFVTLFILSLFVFILAIIFYYNSKPLLAAILAIEFVMSPITILIASLINKPAEKHINKTFIKDAKQNVKNINQLKTIMVGGSFGKTSVKNYLNYLLSVKYNVLMVSDNIEGNIDIVKAMGEKLNNKYDIFLCETCAKKLGDIENLCEIVKPDVGIITNIGEQNLNFFKNIENIEASIKELYNAFFNDGNLFINGDMPKLQNMCQGTYAITYGLGENNVYKAFNVGITQEGTIFDIITPNGETETFITTLLGEHNIRNLTGAIAIANSLDIPLKDLVAPVKGLKSVPHRLELITKPNSIIIDDSSNSNPEGAEIALDILSGFTEYTKVLITPGMNNFGKKQDIVNYNFGAIAAGACDYVVLIGKKQTKHLLAGLIEADFDMDKIFVVNNLANAFITLEELNSSIGKKAILIENDVPESI